MGDPTHQDRDSQDRTGLPLGMQPGVNGNGLGPSFRQQDGDARHPVRTFLLTTVPVLVIVVVVLLTR